LPKGVRAQLRHRPGRLPEQEGVSDLKRLLDRKVQVGPLRDQLDFEISRRHELNGDPFTDISKLGPATTGEELKDLFDRTGSVQAVRAAITHPNAPPELHAWGQNVYPEFSNVPAHASGGLPGAVEPYVEMSKLMNPLAFEPGANRPARGPAAPNPVQHTKNWAGVGEISLENASPNLQARILEKGLPARGTQAAEDLEFDLKYLANGGHTEKDVRRHLLPKSKQEIMRDRAIARNALPEFADAMHPRSVAEAQAAHRAALDAESRAFRAELREETPHYSQFKADTLAQKFKQHEKQHGTVSARDAFKAQLAELEEEARTDLLDASLLERMRASSHPEDIPPPAPAAATPPISPAEFAPTPSPPPAPVLAGAPTIQPSHATSSAVSPEGPGIGAGTLAAGLGGVALLGGAGAYAASRKKKEDEKTADLGGSRPMAYGALPQPKKPLSPPTTPVTKQAMTLDLTNKEAPSLPGVKLADTHFALGTHYPITAPTQVKMACAYFEEHVNAFPPEHRREFAYNLCKRASELGFPEWLGESARIYGGEPTEDLDTIKRAFHSRQEYLPWDDDEKRERGLALLDKLEPKLAYITPSQRVDALTTFDRAFGLDRLYSQGHLEDPHRALTQKWAEAPTFSEVVDGLTVLEDDLVHLATKRPTLKEHFSDEIVEKMQVNPVATFKSLPAPLKVLMARCAKSMTD